MASAYKEDGYLAPIVDDDNPEEAVDPLYVPEGFKTVEDYLEYVRKTYQDDYDYDKENRDMALDDLKFIAGEIWDPAVEAAREGRPCPKINTLPQYIGQVIGDRRMNKTSIKLRPAKDATAKEAQIRAGIIKGIEYRSKADRVYDQGLDNQVSCGIGNWRVYLDYAEDDVFEQDIFIGGIPNPLAVLWDRFSFEPTGRDADHVFVQDIMPDSQFEKQWPKAKPDLSLVDELGLAGAGWYENNATRVCEFWEMKTRVKTVALNVLGQIIEVTEENKEQLVAENKIMINPRTGEPLIREARIKYACMHLVTGTNILAGPYELPINRLPIIRAEGRIVNVGDDRYRYSLTRWMKDPIRNRCYMRAVVIEELAMAPKAYWLAEDAAVEDYQEDFRNAHLSQDPLLRYKQGMKEPKRIEPPRVNAAAINQELACAQDMKDVSGIHDASLGIRSNEVSGRAINARKVEGDVATVIYHDNHNAAIAETGDVVNQLLSVCYDTIRQLLSIDEADKDSLVEVNNPANPESIDLSKGKYTAVVETGPSFTTQRQEGAQAMMEMIKVAPDIMGLAADLIAKYQDFPGAIEIAERLKKAMKAKGVDVGDEEGGQQIPPEMVEQIKQSVLAEFMQSAQGQQLQLQLKKEEQELRKAVSDADKAEADADRAKSEAEKAELEAEAFPDVHAAEVLKKAQQPERPSGNQNRSGAPRRAARPKKQSKGNKQ